MKLIWNNH